jgi:DNA-binding NarL/FixJ family response regulator
MSVPEVAAKENSMNATILAVSEDRSFHNALRDLLNHDPDFQLLGKAENGEQAVRSTSEFHPDVVLMDFTGSHVNGLEATRKIKSCLPYTKVIALSLHSAIDYERAVLDIGPDAFIAKQGLRSELLPTIRHVLAPARNHPRKPVSVFMVDDDAAFLTFAADYLNAQKGIVVRGSAHSGKEAIGKTSSLKPDVAVVDLEIPDVPGLEVISTLRRTLPYLGIIAFSFLNLSRYSKQVFSAGADKFIPKSGLMTDLVPAILTLAKHDHCRSGMAKSKEPDALHPV